MKRPFYVVAGAAVGLFAGWVLFGHAGEAQAPVAASASVSHPAAVAGPPTGWPGGSVTGNGGPASGAGGPADNPTRPAPVISPLEMEKLRARVAELEHKLALQNKAASEKEGAPLPMPEHLDPRFDSERIRNSINAALKQAGLDGETTSVDCSEFPCLAIGEMRGTSFGPEQTTQVSDLLHKMGYNDDSTHGFGASVEENGQRRNLWGLAIFPKTDDSDQQQLISKRLHYRFNASQGIE